MTKAIETAPELKLEPQDIENLLDELHDYHAIYNPLFYRREQQEWYEKYVRGLLLNIPDKSIEPMVLAMQGADPHAVRAMQHFISEGAWDDTLIHLVRTKYKLKRHWREVKKRRMALINRFTQTESKVSL